MHACSWCFWWLPWEFIVWSAWISFRCILSSGQSPAWSKLWTMICLSSVVVSYGKLEDLSARSNAAGYFLLKRLLVWSSAPFRPLYTLRLIVPCNFCGGFIVNHSFAQVPSLSSYNPTFVQTTVSIRDQDMHHASAILSHYCPCMWMMVYTIWLKLVGRQASPRDKRNVCTELNNNIHILEMKTKKQQTNQTL